MRAEIALLFALIVSAGCSYCDKNSDQVPGYKDLPGPPINTLQIVKSDESPMGRSRGIVDIELTAENPSMTFWNDRENQTDEWGTIRLISLDNCCTATIEFGNKTLSTTPGNVFPRTGLYLVKANPDTGSIWIRSRWTHTVMRSDTLK